MKGTTKVLALSSALLLAALSFLDAKSLFFQGASALTFEIAGGNAVSYSLYRGDALMGSLSKQGSSYVYDGDDEATSANLYDGDDTFTLYINGIKTSVAFVPSVEGHYGDFTYDGSVLTASMIDKAVYLKQLNSNRLWDDYYVYSYSSTGDEAGQNAAYPGVKMEVLTANVLTKSFIPPSADRVIFSYSGISSSGALTSSDCVKTGDLTYDEAKPCFQMSDHNNVSATSSSDVSVTASYSGNSGLFLAGSFNNWTGGKAEYLLEQTQSPSSDGSDQYVVKPKASQGASYKLVVGSLGGSNFSWYGTSYVRIWLDAPSWWAGDSAIPTIGMWGSSASYTTKTMTKYAPSFSTSDLWYYYDLDSAVYTGVKFYRKNPNGSDEWNATGDLAVPTNGSANNVYIQSSSSWTSNSTLGASAVQVPAGTLLSASKGFNVGLPSVNPHLLFKKASNGYYVYYL